MRPEGISPRRHPEQGGYACGEATRARIVAAAIQVFGEQGYDQASTRKIAASAGVNPPALQYYFHSKEGLHLACAQYIADRVWENLAPALERGRAALVSGGRQRAMEALCGVIEALAEGLVATGSESWSRFIARGKADGAGPAISIIRERISTPLLEVTTQLVGAVRGTVADAEETRLRACTVLGQVSSLYANRENTLAVMGWSQFDAHALALIKRVIREHTRGALLTAKSIVSA